MAAEGEHTMFLHGGQAEYMIAGLGNPEKKYEGTRHNTGFEALDYLAQAFGIRVAQSKWNALYGLGEAAGHKVVLLKPLTYMNLSGEAVGAACRFYKIPPQHVIVLFDDVSLAPGRIRIRTEGSAGGHNGLKCIIAHIGQEFPRVKIGVGQKPTPEYDLAAWVLGRLGPEERAAQRARFDDVCEACRLIMEDKAKEAMNRYNG